MHSNRPYLLKASFKGIANNHCHLYVIVDANQNGVDMSDAFVHEGPIVFKYQRRGVDNVGFKQEQAHQH